MREADLAELRRSFWRRNRWLMWVAGGLVAGLAIFGAIAAVLAHRAEPYLRARILAALTERFHARVELEGFHMALGGGWRGPWGVWAEGTGLRIWPPAQVEGITVSAPAAGEAVEPLIRLNEFKFQAPLQYESGNPFHISVVELNGLDVRLPPKERLGLGTGRAAGPQQTNGQTKGDSGTRAELNFSVDSLECNGARLTMETSKPGKLPLEFAIARLKLTEVASGGTMGFDAELTNPMPVGTIYVKGRFGPWQFADPGESMLTGGYRFEHADLASFKEIAGILTSMGSFEGTLRDLTVDGETDTPDFRLTHFGNSLPLHTKFHAKVDGTNGDTWLEPVDATLGHSHFTAQGQIVRVAPQGNAQQSAGHDIALDVDVDRGRIEDFLLLASHSETPMLTGAVTVKTTLHLPPGAEPVHRRLQLNGAFTLDEAQFTSAKIQDRILELSLRGQGRPKDVKTTDPASVQSTMEGTFHMADGAITLPVLKYTVPGAAIQLKGIYGVEGGALDFSGTAKLEATVSEVVGGWKGLLLKPADRFFKKGGAGTEVAIHISGTREEPKFGVEFDKKKGSSGDFREWTP